MRSYEHRTPLAWRHRDMHHHHHHRHSRHHQHRRHHQTSSVSPSSSSSSDDEEVPMVRSARPGSRSQFSAAEHFRGGTLRSTRSVPALALATWDGEPCPVHGHGVPHPPLFHAAAGTMRRHGSLFDVRPQPTLFPPPPPLLDKKAFHGSMQFGGAPPWMGAPPPPLLRPPPVRPFVIPAGAEPLPVRDPYRRYATGPSKEMAFDMDDQGGCCKGHLIVLWIILAVVTVGVILGIVLGVTIA